MSLTRLRADASYVLDWLRQTEAPPNIVALQEDVVTALGGYVGPSERMSSNPSEQAGVNEQIRLCVQTHHPLDVGNYDGPIHCTAHPEGTACVTALYERVPDTTVTAEERESV